MVGLKIEPNYITSETKALFLATLEANGIDLRSEVSPWLPIGNIGPILILGHFDSSKTPFSFPLTQRFLIEKSVYGEIIEDLLEHSQDIDTASIIIPESPHKGLLSAKCILKGNVLIPRATQAINDEHIKEICALTKLVQDESAAVLDPVSIRVPDLDPLPKILRSRFKAFTLSESDKEIFICTAGSNNIELKDQILGFSKKSIKFLKTSSHHFEAYEAKTKALSKNKQRRSVEALPSSEEEKGDQATRLKIDLSTCGCENPFDKQNNLSALEVLQWIIYQAYIQEASDIHFEQAGGRGRIRIRIDGELSTLLACSLDEMHSLVNVSFDTCGIQREPNADGSFLVELESEIVPIRMNSIPFRNSFLKLNFRILATENKAIELEEAIGEEKHIHAFKRAISRPQGLILITGPTGSGKTTTLYSCLEHINETSKNIQTIEDPIERNIEGLNQSQIDTKRDITFSRLMKSVLRQDPDIILLGEMRDKESSELAVQAALTGHLVFSTLHANDALGGINRMLQIGIPTDLFADSLLLIQAQRLAKKLCPHCKTRKELTQEELDLFSANDIDPEKSHIYTSKKCSRCAGKGYIGRTAIMEIVQFNPSIAELVMNKKSIESIRSKALEYGYEPLFKAALRKVKSGEISIDEALKLQPAWEA